MDPYRSPAKCPSCYGQGYHKHNQWPEMWLAQPPTNHQCWYCRGTGEEKPNFTYGIPYIFSFKKSENEFQIETVYQFI